MTGTIDRRELKALKKELRQAKREGLGELEQALQILAVDAAIDPAALSTRQQRRKAARELQKKRARGGR
jgi:hypothetical protein